MDGDLVYDGAQGGVDALGGSVLDEVGELVYGAGYLAAGGAGG